MSGQNNGPLRKYFVQCPRLLGRLGPVFVLALVARKNHENQQDDPADERYEYYELQPSALIVVVQSARTNSQVRDDRCQPVQDRNYCEHVCDSCSQHRNYE